MNTMQHLSVRDTNDFTENDEYTTYRPSTNSLLFAFSTLLLVGTLCILALMYLRRRRQKRNSKVLPVYHPTHHRSASITNFPPSARNEAVFVYDEKMNLIANSSSPPSRSIPEIRITFPDEEGITGERQKGRVVVVHVTDSGSVGMSPLQQDHLPPYQRGDAERFQSLDLERIGGLREKESSPQRWS